MKSIIYKKHWWGFNWKSYSVNFVSSTQLIHLFYSSPLLLLSLTGTVLKVLMGVSTVDKISFTFEIKQSCSSPMCRELCAGDIIILPAHHILTHMKGKWSVTFISYPTHCSLCFIVLKSVGLVIVPGSLHQRSSDLNTFAFHRWKFLHLNDIILPLLAVWIYYQLFDSSNTG